MFAVGQIKGNPCAIGGKWHVYLPCCPMIGIPAVLALFMNIPTVSPACSEFLIILICEVLTRLLVETIGLLGWLCSSLPKLVRRRVKYLKSSMRRWSSNFSYLRFILRQN